jgi:hypothetical protein
METKRKEVIQLNGLTILVVMALVADFLIVGFVYRFHQWKLFTMEKAHHKSYTVLLRQEHDVKDEVVRLEGVSVWNDTAYAKALGRSE